MVGLYNHGGTMPWERTALWVITVPYFHTTRSPLLHIP